MVVLNAVFHWLPEKTGPLLSFGRVLRPGGRLGICTGLKGDLSQLQQIVGAVLAEPPFDRYRQARDSDHLPGRRRRAARAVPDHRLRADPIEVRTNEQAIPRPRRRSASPRRAPSATSSATCRPS